MAKPSSVVRTHLMAFVTRLRRAGVRISVAETLDAMAAVSAAGLDRVVLREALAATLVKDEADRAAFDAAFDEHFPLLAADGSTGKGKRRGARTGGEGDPSQASRAGSGTGSGAGSAPPPASTTARPEPRPAKPRASEPRRDADAERPARAAARPVAAAAAERTPPTPSAGREPRTSTGQDAPHDARRSGGDEDARPRIVRRPFADLDPDALDEARAAAREIGRRFAARTSRRERRMRRGRIDIRRTIRRAVARGGALVDLQRRGRRPGKPALVVLCDVSGSVARASDLLLALLAGCESAFARVTRFAFVDRLVSVEYVDGQIRPDGELDLYGFSDHGAVLAELDAHAEGLVDRRTVLLVLGDARNNRRPARADALTRLARRARAVVWAVPESRARWDTGDSALASYASSCDRVVEATSLAGLATAVRESAA